MTLIYKGEDGVMRVNGRLMKAGDKIIDQQEVKDLTGVEGFEQDSPPRPKRPKAKE